MGPRKPRASFDSLSSGAKLRAFSSATNRYPTRFVPTDLAFEIIAREYITLLGVFARSDRSAAHQALTSAEARITAHLYLIAERLGGEPEWLLAAASTLRRAVAAARDEIDRSLN
jgi:hypothetical protein